MSRWITIGMLMMVGGIAVATADGHPTSEVRRLFPGNSLSVLQQCEQLTLFSISPENVELDYRGPKPEKTLHGYPIHRERVIEDGKARKAIIHAVLDGMANQNKIVRKRCFTPHHGLRATRGSESVELVLCFECHGMIIYRGTQPSTARISRSPQRVLDRYLSSP